MADFNWDGEKVRATLENATFQGLQSAGEHLLRVSSDRAPWEEGDLARSGTVTSDEFTGTVAVAYDRVYARRQHEELTWRHKPGKTAKYLEDPMSEEAGTMLAIIAKAGRKATGD